MLPKILNYSCILSLFAGYLVAGSIVSGFESTFRDKIPQSPAIASAFFSLISSGYVPTICWSIGFLYSGLLVYIVLKDKMTQYLPIALSIGFVVLQTFILTFLLLLLLIVKFPNV